MQSSGAVSPRARGIGSATQPSEVAAIPDSPRISLSLVIHNHQPVGNFGFVFEDVFEHAYRPFVELLTRHPSIRCGLHYSGPLLEWIRSERPRFLELVGGLVEREQVELVGGGYYEPILSSIPQRDRIGQLRRMSADLEGMTGRRPRGAWLAERVWEPQLPADLADGGYEWTIVDDAHLRAAAIPDEEHWGTFTTDDQGRRITIFGTEQGLRYLIPFRDVEEVIDHLRAHATPDGSRLGMMGDDGEKFGGWPTTFEHCWGEGRWMERFFDALDANAAWLSTVRPSDWIDAHPPVGRVYLPTSSYTEMTEWALPPDDAIAFHRALATAVAEARPEAQFLRGGFWRNFQRRYREINDLHKQMLRVSAKVEAMAGGPAREAALDLLYRGQSNDCYWHGLFGGIYLTDVRHAAYANLIGAEDAADSAGAASNAATATRSTRADVDVDGLPEILFESPGQVVVIKPDAGAAIAAWDLRGPRHALTAVLRRRPEAYHRMIVAAADERLTGEGANAARDERGVAAGQPAKVESIDEIVRESEPGLAGRIVYDRYERRSGLVHLLFLDETAADLAAATAVERADVLDQPYEVVELGGDRVVARRDATARLDAGDQAIHVEKAYRFEGDRHRPSLTLAMRILNRSLQPLAARLAVEWNLLFLGGGGNPAAYYDVGTGRLAHDSSGEVAGVTSVASGNTDLGVALISEVAPSADAWWYPIDTISHSESGFERVYQGSSLVLSWPLDVAPGGSFEAEVRQQLYLTRDRAAEGRAATAPERRP